MDYIFWVCNFKNFTKVSPFFSSRFVFQQIKKGGDHKRATVTTM